MRDSRACYLQNNCMHNRCTLPHAPRIRVLIPRDLCFLLRHGPTQGPWTYRWWESLTPTKPWPCVFHECIRDSPRCSPCQLWQDRSCMAASGYIHSHSSLSSHGTIHSIWPRVPVIPSLVALHIFWVVVVVVVLVEFLMWLFSFINQDRYVQTFQFHQPRPLCITFSVSSTNSTMYNLPLWSIY